ncbi:hypothetical protein KSS87_014168 [Heliosperma pusillum]|nr:hypothetical protein KSS87_014168 [Heliosperma pusillum]
MAEGRSMKATTTKTKTKVLSWTTPYNVYDLKSRRRYKTSCNSTKTTAFEEAKDGSSDLEALSCCSSNSTCSQIVQDLEVESEGETSSKFVYISKLISEIGTTMTTTKPGVEIKYMIMPSEFEIEEFFSSTEKDLHKCFSDKYNFDVVKDVPLEGRYEWVEIKP